MRYILLRFTLKFTHFLNPCRANFWVDGRRCKIADCPKLLRNHKCPDSNSGALSRYPGTLAVVLWHHDVLHLFYLDLWPMTLFTFETSTSTWQNSASAWRQTDTGMIENKQQIPTWTGSLSCFVCRLLGLGAFGCILTCFVRLYPERCSYVGQTPEPAKLDFHQFADLRQRISEFLFTLCSG